MERVVSQVQAVRADSRARRYLVVRGRFSALWIWRHSEGERVSVVASLVGVSNARDQSRGRHV
jgi:hypothetical protein